jgi:DNA helicase II / ATP-dependent DNA helicase PcrA
MKKIVPTAWVPADSLQLEENALKAITSTGNSLVVAGPGSGKTELLAQKACYLLQTQNCQYPRRILAISFKRDAAFNLKERVNLRCGEVLSRRFDSYTFDAFSKQILDRFRDGLPAPYKIAGTYIIMNKPKQEIENAFRSVDLDYFSTHNHDYNSYLTSVPLPHDTSQPSMDILHGAWQLLTKGNNPKVNFQMIMRLAEYIITANPEIRAYLQQTYSHIFLDEFQDTTYLQYDFLKACFMDCNVNYTAVGDDKQTIMGWAGAMPDIFKAFIKDTNATKLPLVMNFRSAPKLVALQNYLIKELLNKSDFATSCPKWKPDEGEAKMCFFQQQSQEMDYLLQQIQLWTTTEQLNPRDICILVKQLPAKYTADLIALLLSHGIRVRDETALQDLLSEEVSLFMINFIQVIFSKEYGQESEAVFNFLCNVNASYDDLALLRLKKTYLKFCRDMQNNYEKGNLGNERIRSLMNDILQFTGVVRIKNAYPQYQQGTWFRQIMTDLFNYLSEQYALSKNIITALATLKGIDTIPVMTTHKSKGLEYHTVIFIGLEDGAFWTYQKQPDSDNNLLFVALSRAKERVLFTFCVKRPFEDKRQSAFSIRKIHALLKGFPNVEVLDF